MYHTQLTTRLGGTPQEYYVLRVISTATGTTNASHTSKKLSYILKMRDRYKEPRCD